MSSIKLHPEEHWILESYFDSRTSSVSQLKMLT